VLAPALFNFDMSLFQDAKDLRDLPLRDPMILRQFDARLKPHLHFPFAELTRDAPYGGADIHDSENQRSGDIE